jgi:phosphohistidine phosphatase
MTNLILFRHGIAVPRGTPDMEDAERSLTPKGERRTRQVVRGLRPFLRGVERILTSPLPRALRTAEIVADVLKISSVLEVTDELLPEAEPREMRAFVEKRQERGVMLVGHNPNLSDLLASLVSGKPRGGPFELKKAGAASLRRGQDGTYNLDWLLPPKVARRLDGRG